MQQGEPGNRRTSTANYHTTEDVQTMIQNLQVMISAFAGAFLALTVVGPDKINASPARVCQQPARVAPGSREQPAMTLDTDQIVAAFVSCNAEPDGIPPTALCQTSDRVTPPGLPVK